MTFSSPLSRAAFLLYAFALAGCAASTEQTSPPNQADGVGNGVNEARVLSAREQAAYDARRTLDEKEATQRRTERAQLLNELLAQDPEVEEQQRQKLIRQLSGESLTDVLVDDSLSQAQLRQKVANEYRALSAEDVAALNMNCNQPYTNMASSKRFLFYSLHCAWQPDEVLRLSGLSADEAFSPPRNITMPMSLYGERVLSDSGDPLPIDCARTMSVQLYSLEDVYALRAACENDLALIAWLNNIEYEDGLYDPMQWTSEHHPWYLRRLMLPAMVRRIWDDAQKTALGIRTTASPPMWCEETTYIVRDAQTLANIAAQCGFSATSLGALNGIEGRHIYRPIMVNSSLLLPNAVRVADHTNTPADARNMCNEDTYRLAVGETLADIADACGWNHDLVLRLNGLNRRHTINGPYDLVLPSSLYAANPQTLADVQTEAIDCTAETRMLVNGETLTDIANACNINPVFLRKINFADTLQVHWVNRVYILPARLQRVEADMRAEQRAMIERAWTVCAQSSMEFTSQGALNFAAYLCGWYDDFLNVLNGIAPEAPLVARNIKKLPAAVLANEALNTASVAPLDERYQRNDSTEPRALLYEVPESTSVRAVQDGMVVFAYYSHAHGTHLLAVRHNAENITLYKGLDMLAVQAGERVLQGDMVGKVQGALEVHGYAETHDARITRVDYTLALNAN